MKQTVRVLCVCIFTVVFFPACLPYGSVSITPTYTAVPYPYGVTVVRDVDAIFRDPVPIDWRKIYGAQPRYEVNITSTNGGTMNCGMYALDPDNPESGTTLLTFTAVHINVAIYDLPTNTEIAANTFNAQLPESCPETHNFMTMGATTLPGLEKVTPTFETVEAWIIETMIDQPDLPPTSTPYPTREGEATETPPATEKRYRNPFANLPCMLYLGIDAANAVSFQHQHKRSRADVGWHISGSGRHCDRSRRRYRL